MKKIIVTGFISALLIGFISCNKKTQASCSDGIKNQNEILADCGGSCKPCETCFDGVMNQNETGVDCGGVCNKCATCSDGIQNQGETDIDCGGPCAKCPIIYSEMGNYGANLLSDNLAPVTGGLWYSIRASVPYKGSLKLVITGSSFSLANYTTGWGVEFGSLTSPMVMFADGQVVADAKVRFPSGSISTIEFYENGATTPTKTKTITF